MDRHTVWIRLPQGGDPLPCGLLEWDGRQARFAYGRRYAARPDAISLAPDMPLDAALRDEWFFPVQDDPLPGPIADVAPGRWAEYVLTRIEGRRLSPLELLLGAHARIGALSFTPSPDQPPSAEPTLPTVADLNRIAKATQAIEAGDAPPAIRLALHHNPSVGGRRPKADVQDEHGRWWIAKFESRMDAVPGQPLLEALGLSLAMACGIRVPRFEVRRIGGRPVLLVERFDRIAPDQRLHLLSAKTLLRLCERNLDLDGSYPAIGEQLRRLGASADMALEWLDRCVFNILIGNTDDHPLNHLFWWNGRALFLQPAFDLEPQGGGLDRQQMQVGPQGSQASLDNAIAAHASYGLKLKEARERAVRVRDVLAKRWRLVAKTYDLQKAQIDVVRSGMRL